MGNSPSRATIRVMISHFEEQYGHDAVERFVKMVREGRTLKEIGDMFGVSRQRALQWREAFGDFRVVVEYQLHPIVEGTIKPVGGQLRLTMNTNPVDNEEE